MGETSNKKQSKSERKNIANARNKEEEKDY